MTHATFIALAYGVAGVALGLTALKIALDHRALKRALEKIGAPVDERESAP